jgi:hypothetical protein
LPVIKKSLFWLFDEEGGNASDAPAALLPQCPEPQNYPELIGQQSKCSRKSA